MEALRTHADRLETLLGKGTMGRRVASVIVGSVLYRFVIALALKFNIPAECLKLVSAIIVGFAIALPTLKSWAAFEKRKHAPAARKEGL